MNSDSTMCGADYVLAGILLTPAGILCRILGVWRHLLNSDTLQMLASFARGDRQRRDVGGLREGLPWPCCIDPPTPPIDRTG